MSFLQPHISCVTPLVTPVTPPWPPVTPRDPQWLMDISHKYATAGRRALRALDVHPSAFLNAEAPSPQNGTAPLLDVVRVVQCPRSDWVVWSPRRVCFKHCRVFLCEDSKIFAHPLPRNIKIFFRFPAYFPRFQMTKRESKHHIFKSRQEFQELAFSSFFLNHQFCNPHPKPNLISPNFIHNQIPSLPPDFTFQTEFSI